jgi:hypothetical protein
MSNEYIVYWRREVLYRTKVIANTEEEALKQFTDGYSAECEYLEDIDYEEDIDEYGDMQIDNVELIEENAE